jgi:dephospho-CoA kinase
VRNFHDIKLIGLCGKAGAGKDSVYEHVLKPKGYLRWQMTLHYKTWLVATGRATFEEAFVTKPPHVRKILQEELTDLRQEWSESIWLDVFKSWMVSLHEIVGIDVTHVAVTDLRFLIEMRGLKDLGGKILHIEASDQQANVAPELRGHRSEAELDSPEVLQLRDAYLFNGKKCIHDLWLQGYDILRGWGWL